jgi:hypothetical protein
MSAQNDRTNGFKIRALNADADRIAVQSSRQSTWALISKRRLLGTPKWHEVGLARDELVVLRPYNGRPVIELEGLGGPHGVLIVDQTQTMTRTLRNGSRLRLELKKDEAVVIKTEFHKAPGSSEHNLARV